LGRAGAARPSPPEPPVAPPGPPTRAAASATTTHRGRAPSRGRQPGGGCRHLALQPAPAPTAPPPATGAPHARPGLPGRSAGKRGHRGPHPTRRPGSATDLPPTNATWASSPASRPPRASIEPSTARPPPGPPPVPVVTVARPLRLGPKRHRLSMGGDGRVRTDGADTRRLDTARVDSRRLDTGRLDSRRPTAGPAGRPSQVTGHRTAGQPDAETGWVDTAYWTPATDAVACLLAGSTTATTPRALDTGWTLLGADAVWASNNRTAQQQGRRGHHAATDGPGHRRDRQLQVVRRRPAGALVHCCPRMMSG
jgi:hypothetical protein